MKTSLSIPHFGYNEEVVMDELYKVKEQLNGKYDDINVSYMPFLIKSASLALKEFPILNARLSEDEKEIVYYARHHISIAMDTPRGLIVPNIKDVQGKSILDIARDLVHLQELGNANKLGETELTGGTFSYVEIFFYKMNRLIIYIL